MTSVYEFFHTFLVYWFPEEILTAYPDIFVWFSVLITLAFAFGLIRFVLKLPKMLKKF